MTKVQNNREKLVLSKHVTSPEHEHGSTSDVDEEDCKNYANEKLMFETVASPANALLNGEKDDGQRLRIEATTYVQHRQLALRI